MERNTVVFCRIVVATMAVLRNVGALCIGGQRPVNIDWTDGEQRKYSWLSRECDVSILLRHQPTSQYILHDFLLEGLMFTIMLVDHAAVYDNYVCTVIKRRWYRIFATAFADDMP